MSIALNTLNLGSTPEALEAEQKLDELLNIFSQWMEVLAQFPRAEAENVHFDKWSLKDILAHLCGWNLLTLDTLYKTAAGIDQITRIDDFDEFNQVEVGKRATRTWEEIYSEFVATSYSLVSVYAQMPSSIWQKQVNPAEEFSVLDCLIADLQQYTVDHLPDIREVLNRLAD